MIYELLVLLVYYPWILNKVRGYGSLFDFQSVPYTSFRIPIAHSRE